jgi:hypothetical protein
MTISVGDAAILRYPYTRRTNTTLNIADLELVGTAEIDTFSVTYPRGSYPVINTAGNIATGSVWADGKRGQVVRIVSPSGVVKFDGILRRANSADTVYIAGHVQGDAGLASEFAIPIAQNDIVSVYAQQAPQSFLSALSPEGILLKRFDIPFNASDPQTSSPKPQVNIGVDQQYRVTAGGSVTGVPLDASDSYSWIGSTLSYSWELPVGVTLASGLLTDPSITVDIDEGQHIIVCRVEDDVTNEPARGRRTFYVNSPDAPAFSDEYTVSRIDEFRLTRSGWQASFTVSGDIPVERLYTGAAVLFTYDLVYSQDGITWVQTDDEQCSRRSYKGYIHSFSDVLWTLNGRIKSVTFVVKSLLNYLDDIPIASQAIQYADPPTNWQQSPYTDLDSLLQIVMRYHSDVLNEDGDLYRFGLTELVKPIHAVNAGAFSGAMKEIAANRLGGNIGNISNGQMYMRPHRSYENDSFRSSQTARYTFIKNDLTGGLFRYSLNELMRYSQTNGAFFISGINGEPILSVRGLGAPMQGAGINQTPVFVASTQGDGLARVGHDHQNKNRRFDKITLFTYADGVVEPAYLDAFTIDLDELDALESGVLDQKTFIPVEVRYRFPDNLNSGIPPLVEIDLEPETKGLPATKVTAKPIGGWPFTYDFTLTDGGFINSDPYGQWTNGVGWEGGGDGDPDLWLLYIDRYITPTLITQVRVIFECVYVGSDYGFDGVILRDAGSNYIDGDWLDSDFSAPTPTLGELMTLTLNYSGTTETARVHLTLQSSDLNDHWFVIKSIRFRGVGPVPF